MWSSEDAKAGREARIASVQPFFCQRLMLIGSGILPHAGLMACQLRK